MKQKKYDKDLSIYLKLPESTYIKLKEMKDTESHIFINGIIYDILKHYCKREWSVDEAIRASDFEPKKEGITKYYSFYFPWAEPETVKLLLLAFRSKTNLRYRACVMDGLVNLYREKVGWKK